MNKLITNLIYMLTKNDISTIESLLQKERLILKEEILVFKDEIVGGIKDLQIDVTATKGYGDRLEEHEKRILKLEEKCEIY